MAITAARLQVDVDADTRSAESRLKKFSSGLGGTVARWGKMFAVAGVGVGAAFATKAIKGAVDLNETLSKTETVFGKASKKVTGFADDMAKAFGLPKQEILDAASNIGLVAKASGLGQAAAAEMSTEMAQLAADASSFYNIPLADALEKIRSGLVGEAEPLRSMGVLLSAAAVEQEAVALGIAKVGEELDEQQKVMARASLITKGMADASGDLDRTQDSLANRFRTLQGRATNFAAAVGMKMIPVVEGLFDWGERMQAEWAPRIRGAFDSVKGWWDSNGQGLLDGARAVLDGIGDAIGGVVDFANNLAALAGAGNWSELGRTIGEAIASAFDTLGDMSGRLYTMFIEWFRSVDWVGLGIELGKAAVPLLVGLAAGLLAFDFGALLSGLAEHWQTILVGVLTIAFAPGKLIGVVANMLRRIPFAGKLIAWGLEAINTFGHSILRGIGRAFSVFSRGFMQAIGRTGPGVFARFRSWLADFPTWIRLWGEELGKRILNAFQRLGNWIGRHGPAQVVRGLRAVKDRMLGYFSSAGSWLLNAGQDIVRGLWNGIKGMGSWLAGKVTGFVKNAVPGPIARALGIRSPSKVAEDLARQVPRGMMIGMEAEAGNLAATARRLAAAALPDLTGPATPVMPQMGGARGGRHGATAGGGPEVIQLVVDRRVLAAAVRRENAWVDARGGSAL